MKNKFITTVIKRVVLIALVLVTQFALYAQSDKHIVPYIDKSGRDVCLAWDNTTGQSVFYNWSGSISNWKAYEINLPGKPLAGVMGKIMMMPYIDKTGRDVCLIWDTKSGKSVFYNWSGSISNWKAYEINLPSSPISGATGDIMMAPYIDKSGRDVVLVWDTKTGKSVFYNWSGSISNWKAYEINLPSSPVSGATGTIMMAPYIDKSGRDVVLTWDTKTGKSVFYNWSGSISNWKAYEINLPSSPVSGATGEIMMRPYIDKTGRDVVLAWDKSTGESVFYNWSSSISNWKAYEINLPSKPVAGSTGDIMMVPYIDKSGRDVVLAYDVSTGTSVFYNWSGSISNWKAYEINLPATPVK